MKKVERLLSVLGMMVGLHLVSLSAIAESSSARAAAAQQEPEQPPAAPNTALETNNWIGKIMQPGDWIVLSDAPSKIN